jgi:cytochrome oxidase Cu insertion factor (SCO1/SenC/PrrC family)
MSGPCKANRSRYAVAGMVCLLLGVAGLQSTAPAAEPTVANLYELPFDWQDEHGELARLGQWQGHTLMLTMAYSICREVCSYTLHRLEQLQQSAASAGLAVDIVVVSYDPSVDGPGSWLIYRRRHHLLRTDWHFLTGSDAVTKQFAAALDFPSWLYDEHRVHDFKILLINPAGEIASTLTWANRNEDFFAKAAPRCRHPDNGSCRS